MNYPGIQLNVNRVHAGELGLSQKDVIDNVITALNSNYMIAPNYWVDYGTGNDYYLTVQYYENGHPSIHNVLDLSQIPLRAPSLSKPTTLDTVVRLNHVETPTEIDHYQIQRVSDVYVTPKGEDLGKVQTLINRLCASLGRPTGEPSQFKLSGNALVTIRGMVNGMNQSLSPSFCSF
jgi:multidrug efflux pump subunit AcrB